MGEQVREMNSFRRGTGIWVRCNCVDKGYYGSIKMTASSPVRAGALDNAPSSYAASSHACERALSLDQACLRPA